MAQIYFQTKLYDERPEIMEPMHFLKVLYNFILIAEVDDVGN